MYNIYRDMVALQWEQPEVYGSRNPCPAGVWNGKIIEYVHLFNLFLFMC